jgi:hypothetical protein
MSNQEKFAQCVLNKKTENGVKEQTSWIPLKFAKQDKFIKLKEHGEWEDGWKVVHVGSIQGEDLVMVMRDTHRTHRDVTDI